jgi:hypothetical protein
MKGLAVNGHKEWTTTEDLPKSFVIWLKDRVVEHWVKERKGVVQIASEMGIKPAMFSRWMGGKGPLKKNDIRALADYFDLGIYTLLGIKRPNNQNKI